MTIRRILVLISIIGAIFAAAAAWFLAEQKSDIRADAASQVSLDIYNSAWEKLIADEQQKLIDFGPVGRRRDFWVSANAEPLNFTRSQNASNYFTDYSSDVDGVVVNPMIAALVDNAPRQARKYLTVFFGPPLQKGELLYYQIIDAGSMESIYCRKSLKSRQFDPCKGIYDTSYLGLGSRYDLYGKMIEQSSPWFGFEKKTTSDSEHINFVYSFPISGAQNKVEMIVLVSSSLEGALGNLEEELKVYPYIYNADEFYSIKSGARLPENTKYNFANAQYGQTELGWKGFQCAWTRMFVEVQELDGCGDIELLSSRYYLLPMNLGAGDDVATVSQQHPYLLKLESDYTQTSKLLSDLNLRFIVLIFFALVVIVLVLAIVQNRAFSGLGSAIYVLRELTEGKTDVDIRRRSSIFTSATDEIGQLVSALESYRSRLIELSEVRASQRVSRLKRDRLIIEKMKVLSTQLEGDAKALLEEDIQRMEVMGQKIEANLDSRSETETAESQSNELIGVAFERMSEQVVSLINARTAEMEEARDEAREASLAKSKFLANMSHELRTPLNAIIGYSELLLEEAEDDGLETMAEDLQRITDSGNHLLTLINDILDISKIEAGRLEIFLSQFEVKTVVDILKSVSAPLGEKNNNRVNFELDNDLGVMHSDETRLRQCLLNLISNACKFTENGAVSLHASAYQRAGKEWLKFEVKDTGIGMNEEQMSKIFDDFTQAEGDTTAKYGGTGLGLSITKQLIEMMNGELSVSSQSGKGSTFTLDLPRNADATDKADAVEQPEMGAVTDDDVSEGDRCVLVIDDDIVDHDLVKRRLSDSGYKIISAMDAASGIAKAREYSPDLILLDIVMPGKDGWSVLSELKADETLRDTPIIVVSSLQDDQSAVALGAQAFMSKPLDREILLDKIRELFGETFQDKRALIVDDEESARDIVSRMVESAGMNVATAENGSEALEILSEVDIDLVILDLLMPTMDGFEFLSVFNRTPMANRPPVLVYSAMQLDETLQASLRASCLAVIDKNTEGALVELEDALSEAIR